MKSTPVNWSIEFQGRIGIDSLAIVMLKGYVMREDIEKLIEHLQLSIEDFPKRVGVPEKLAPTDAPTPVAVKEEG